MSNCHAQDISELLWSIEGANDAEISDILLAVMKRKQELHPDWEILLLSLPTNDPQERIRLLDEMFSLLKKYH